MIRAGFEGDAWGPAVQAGEVAALFHVDAKTVSRRAKSGMLPSFTTLSGHRRFRWSDIEPHLGGQHVSGQRH